MVLCLRNALCGRSRYSLAPTLVYQVVGRPQSEFDRLFDPTPKVCWADADEDLDLTISSFVSAVECEEVF